MNVWFRIFRSIPLCCKEVKCVVLCVVYLKMHSNSDREKLNVTVTGEIELSTMRTVSWVHLKRYL
jgi:hypothetical protein